MKLEVVREAIMAQLRRRVPKKADRAAAERFIDRTLGKIAEIPLDQFSRSLRRALAQNSSTQGIEIKRSPDEVMAITKKAALTRLPQSPQIAGVYSKLEAGEKVEPEELEAVRQIIRNLNARQLEKIGVDSRLTGDIDLTPFAAVVESLPLLGLTRENMHVLDWKTPAAGIRNIRHYVFKNNPGLEEMVLEAEKSFTGGHFNFKGFFKLKQLCLSIRRLITIESLNCWGLASYKNAPYFKGSRDVAEKSFPFITHPIFDPLREKEAFQMLKDEFAASFYRDWKIGSHYLRVKGQLSEEELAQHFHDLVINADGTRQALQEENYLLRVQFGGLINQDEIRHNNSWVKKYTTFIFDDLFGVNCYDYLKTIFPKYLKIKLAGKD